ncbi:ubiquitin-like domain-containing protein [Lysinibacillus sp. CNPSo 3705]|uniref:G5 and 3D domain-containing protein n=1 Tax=Lysinibacillus sp. CNPSo 3705 TaxID=3028148 RepID=UPI0023638D84|nr:G5 and 3D domain-containing protein [Lysinibacillus sp. CNPSo 3705]MDD1505075.1 ubiquitin-like domain-containing protein [Lysinibacillus sp. CNPSo 3705]
MKKSFIGTLKSKRTVIRIISLVLFVSVISFVLYQGSKKNVTFDANGETIEVTTHAKTVEQLLHDQNIDVAKHDKISPPLTTKIVNGLAISWEQAKEVTISVDGNRLKVWTTETHVKDILKEANIEVSEHDSLAPGLDTEIGADNRIDIQKAFQVSLVDGVNERQVWSTSTTVANFLKQQGIQLNEFDRVENNLKDVITPQKKITVVRVEKVIDVVEDSLDFTIEKKQDASLQEGKQQVVTAGQKGLMTKTYEIIKENGQVVAKNLQSEKVVKEPQNQVVAVGTKTIVPSVTSVPSNASTASIPSVPNIANTSNISLGLTEPASGHEFYVTATAYTAYCKGCSGTSATGIDLRSNPELKVIAVDPSVIKLGSKVWVEGYGIAVAADTGGAIKGNKIDIFVQSETQAINWGVKNVRIKILN